MLFSPKTDGKTGNKGVAFQQRHKYDILILVILVHDGRNLPAVRIASFWLAAGP